MGVKGGPLEAHVEAHGAAYTTFGLPFHAFCPGEPVVLVIIGVDKWNSVLFGEPNVFVLAEEILPLGVDVRVVEEDCIVDARRRHRLHHLTRTWCAA